jgi:hypothetical protein
VRRIVLSRKGSDAVAGGWPSPVLPDGRLAMLPIPEDGSGVTAAELQVAGRPLADLAAALGITRWRRGRDGWRSFGPGTEVHADPDLDPDALPRPAGWRPLFGQAGAAQAHLRATCGVDAGDLFLFWGWYRHTARRDGGLAWAGDRGGFHALHGWLEIGQVLPVTGDTRLDWARRHPHLIRRDRPRNCLYVATERLSIAPALPGAGTLRWDPALRLTAPGSRLRSRWHVPAALHPDATGQPLTYHADPRRWRREDGHVVLHAQHQGQEFVVPATGDLVAWAAGLLSRSAWPTAILPS